MPITGDEHYAQIYIFRTLRLVKISFWQCSFSLSELLQETNREMSVRVDSTSTKNTILTFATRRVIIHTIPKLLNVGASWQVHTYTVSQNLAPEFVQRRMLETATTFQIPLLYLKLRLSELVSDMTGVKNITQKKLSKSHRKRRI